MSDEEDYQKSEFARLVLLRKRRKQQENLEQSIEKQSDKKRTDPIFHREADEVPDAMSNWDQYSNATLGEDNHNDYILFQKEDAASQTQESSLIRNVAMQRQIQHISDKNKDIRQSIFEERKSGQQSDRIQSQQQYKRIQSDTKEVTSIYYREADEVPNAMSSWDQYSNATLGEKNHNDYILSQKEDAAFQTQESSLIRNVVMQRQIQHISDKNKDIRQSIFEERKSGQQSDCIQSQQQYKRIQSDIRDAESNYHRDMDEVSDAFSGLDQYSNSTLRGEKHNGYGPYQKEDVAYQIQEASSIKDAVKQRTIKSVFQDNPTHSVWQTAQSEQLEEQKASRRSQKQQSEVFKSNKSSHFIKNTVKQTAAAPGRLMKNYVKQAKIAELITSGDVRALVDTSASTAVTGIGKGIQKFGRGIKHLFRIMFSIILKILAPILPYLIVVVASAIILYILIMGYTVDDSDNISVLYSYALTNSMQGSTENGSTNSEKGNSAPSGIVNTHMSSYIYFNQGDYPDAMGCTSNGVTTIRRSGCGLTALASALATWTGDTSITPRTVLNYGLNGRDGNTCSIVLVSSSLYGGMCEKYGLTYETIVPKDAGKLRAALIDGKSVIVLLSNRAKWSDGNYVTSRTHYIVLMGFAQNGKIACMNPAGGNMKYIDFDTVVNDPGTDTFHVIYSEEKLQQWKQEDSK